MEYFIKTSDKFIPKSWAGGKTIELYMFPENADYLKRNFSFRLSTATVEIEKSEFTSLPGISRKLMVLDGSVTLFHENHYSKELKTFESDSFEGGWKTTSVGKCIDFNLMTDKESIGELRGLILKKEGISNCKISDNSQWFFMYMFSGDAKIEIDEESMQLSKGDLLVVKNPAIDNIKVKAHESCKTVVSEIF